eukprot:TRINITY_DN18034_c0_g1_i1.p1 TRINITY_DN18034_c0_g1~~TRINITY_DN18034_c0_g1_i1.p1  ORF type:complete len:192 (+),score=10.78 TRINITY_DN18034_c0_g1_i1:340-915(+)
MSRPADLVQPGYFQESLFGCTDDMGLCCEVCLLYPWVVFYWFATGIKDTVTQRYLDAFLVLPLVSPLICVLAPLFTCEDRHHFARTYHIRESPVQSCFISIFCSCCSLCQMRRELAWRGHTGLRIRTRKFTNNVPSPLCFPYSTFSRNPEAEVMSPLFWSKRKPTGEGWCSRVDDCVYDSENVDDDRLVMR